MEGRSGGVEEWRSGGVEEWSGREEGGHSAKRGSEGRKNERRGEWEVAAKRGREGIERVC